MQARGPACLVLELTPAMIFCRGHLMPFRRLAGDLRGLHHTAYAEAYLVWIKGRADCSQEQSCV